jgi:hypothetical protein
MESAIEHLRYRLKHLYKALGRTLPQRAEQFAPTYIRNDRMVFLGQDFRGGLDDDGIHKVFENLMYEIAHVKDLIIRRVSDRGDDKKRLKEEIRRSRDLLLCLDLANWYKHGPANRGRTESGHRPTIKNVGRVCRIQPDARPGAVAGLTYDWEGGRPKLRSLGGSNEVVFEGDIVDNDGAKLGDAIEVANRAVGAWEKLLRGLSIS